MGHLGQRDMGHLVAVVAVLVAVVVVADATQYRSDKWCASHHLGDHPSGCVQNPGCCYDSMTTTCHSCTDHSHEWCKANGVSVKTCIKLSGCKYDSATKACMSNHLHKAEAVLTCAQAKAKTPTVSCAKDGSYAPEQHDRTYKWCVDKEGVQIVDTHLKAASFHKYRIDCFKMALQYDGYQCPNAVTLNLGSGVLKLNKHENVGNCDLKCQQDSDCEAMGEWCCFNGCGQSCQAPISVAQAKATAGVASADIPMDVHDETKCHAICKQILCAKAEHVGKDGSCTFKPYADCTHCCDGNGGFIGGCLRRRLLEENGVGL